MELGLSSAVVLDLPFLSHMSFQLPKGAWVSVPTLQVHEEGLILTQPGPRPKAPLEYEIFYLENLMEDGGCGGGEVSMNVQYLWGLRRGLFGTF
jgi:hypothetical protein